MDHIFFQKVLNKSFPVLITGETGTGKTYLAKKIFNESLINKRIFLTLNLATTKEDLLESEIFGHVKGAFTGAHENKLGYLQSTGDGTLFLDEIGELSFNSQKKFLRLLDEGIYHQVGSTKELRFAGRIIMATNKNLEDLVDKGLFREDLFYRIKTFHIHLSPPSLNSTEGLGLINSLFKDLARKHQKESLSISEDVIRYIQVKNWKGNIREIKNALELAIVVSEKKILTVEDFSYDSIGFQKKQASISMPNFFFEKSTYQENLEKFEKYFFNYFLKKNNGKICHTANELAISKTTLIQKARKYGINTLQLRASADLKSA